MTTKPTIHLNGTSREQLAEQYAEAYTAVRGAIEALDRCAPNARDYYPLGQDAFGKAVVEHHARLAQLKLVLKDIDELQEHVDTAGK